MKKIFLLLTLSVITSLSAQIPTGYYNTASGSGYTLKTQLFNIINNNTNSLTTSSNYGGLWTLFTQSAFRDHYYENDNTLLDVYSEKPTGPDSYNFSATTQQCGNYSNEGDCYNREHTLPQSVWNSAYPMYSDAHFVLPTDGKVNGVRDNFPYGKVNVASWTSTNGSKLGSNTNSGYAAGYIGTVFEPLDEFKGDVARCLLYFATRYEEQIPTWTYTMFNGTSTQVFTNTFINILVTWNNLDPVSAYEIAKNNAVYTFQGNRNPYIDHPEYVCRVWADACALATNEFEFATLSVFPNPTNNGSISINTNSLIDNIQVISINGQLINDIKNPVKINETYTLDNLPQGFYLLKLSSSNNSVTKKISVN
jgi:endonuclease I